MIEQLEVSNYRSLGDNVKVTFDDKLTVFVGPNGSGKSNVVDALRFAADAVRMGLAGAITDRHGITAVRRWSSGRPYNCRISLQLRLPAERTASYAFELTGDRAGEYRVKTEQAVVSRHEEQFTFHVSDGRWVEGPEDLRPQLDNTSLVLPIVGGDRRFRPLAQALRNVASYAIFPDKLRNPQKYSPDKPMGRHGDNWVSILKDQDNETWKSELVGALHKLTGDIEDIQIKPAASYLVVQFRHTSTSNRAKWFDADQESDGTLRVAGIITALLQEPALPVIGIEEPELTVHPGALPLIYDYLMQAGKRSQVIVTTHSPELLDRVHSEQVRVVSRKDGATNVAMLRDDQRKAVRNGLLSLGDMIRTEGIHAQLPLFPEA